MQATGTIHLRFPCAWLRQRSEAIVTTVLCSAEPSAASTEDSLVMFACGVPEDLPRYALQPRLGEHYPQDLTFGRARYR